MQLEKMPKEALNTVSIIIPCYNQARFLSDAINSVVRQSLAEWECLIINDGSTDKTREVALSFVEADNRIKLFSQENRGLAAARNRGLGLARGRYIQFLDADDLIEPDKLKIQTAVLENCETLGVAYSDYRYCPHDDVTMTVTRGSFQSPRFIHDRKIHDLAKRWESEFSIPCHAFLFDARFFSDFRIRFDEALSNHEDWDCWMQIFSIDPEVFHTEGQLAIYRLHSNSMSVDHKKMYIGFRAALRKQRRIFSRDAVVYHILTEKLRERKLHLQSIHKPRYVSFVQNVYRSNVPWPIQRFTDRAVSVLSRIARRLGK